MASENYGGGCEAYAKAWGVDPTTLEHCTSCHEDEEEGYPMLDDTGPDDITWFTVCCTAHRIVEDLKPAHSPSPGAQP